VKPAPERGRSDAFHASSFTRSGLGYTPEVMLWFTLWFMVILKIPALYLCYVIWWSVKDPPVEAAGEPGDGLGGGGHDPGPRLPRRPLPGRRPGPHGAPVRRHARTAETLPSRAARSL
jgi:hypothetical protein